MFFNLPDHVIAQVEGRQHGVRVAGVDTRRLDMLHDADDVHIFPVADGVGFGFDGVFQEVIEQDVIVRNILQNFHHVLLQFLLVDHDFHALPTQHVAWANQQREAQFPR